MSRIVKPRADGKVHFADCELGDLFYQDGESTIADAVGILADIDARLTRIERQTQRDPRLPIFRPRP